jgi:hypothetical protein
LLGDTGNIGSRSGPADTLGPIEAEIHKPQPDKEHDAAEEHRDESLKAHAPRSGPRIGLSVDRRHGSFAK